ncbi:MAG: glycosyltransferase involved in cell wall biosynthesis [Chlamydiales bacterium]|jgi:glycosyltransferase involved in cell wall biosynthesis
MRILLVSHLFPPDHEAGTERYTAELGQRLAAAGHEVSVFTTTKDIARPDLSVADRSFEGLAVRELVNNLYYDDFSETWRRPQAEQAFGAWLDEWRPDVVHFHHLMYLSAGCLGQAARRGLPTLFTLHDFWLECPRFGQLVHADGSLCATVDPARCGTCLADFDWRQSPTWRRAGRAIAGLRRRTGVNLGPLARAAGKQLRRRAAGAELDSQAPSAPSAQAAAFERSAVERSADLRREVLAHVDRFISPSRFLLERLQNWGLPRDRCVHLPTGIERDRFPFTERVPAARLRVAFLGTLVPVKGAHVLLAAWAALSPEQRDRAQLTLFGPRDHAPEYVAQLELEARQTGAQFGGALGRDEVARTLASTDLLVVPSTWYENRPLVVLEALASGTPVVVSEPGGMAELIEDGVTGWRFPMGDAEALRARLAAVIDDPACLAALELRNVELPSWDTLAERMLELYADALRTKSGEACE